MDPDDEVCLCFHVSLRKIRGYMQRENPPVASLISDCLGAGTGCQWCVPFLRHLHRCHIEGKPVDLAVSPEEYARTRLVYHKTQYRDDTVVRKATGHAESELQGDGATPPPPPAPGSQE